MRAKQMREFLLNEIEESEKLLQNPKALDSAKHQQGWDDCLKYLKAHFIQRNRQKAA